MAFFAFVYAAIIQATVRVEYVLLRERLDENCA